ncbi:hemolysin activation/secretion protein [Roseateles toxinivorans]|uniref:Hemolysin activation/secretion protein n=1 Tax=Roseateles toxinivorans TaxID=270368 RepID=A0A4R6QHR6_9BURK|nr:hemolysin activation/secretion protein [Roseateles toxinivorans]
MKLQAVRLLSHSLLVLGLSAALPSLAQGAAPRVQVTAFAVTGNTLLPQSRLDAVLQPFKGERTLDELKQAALAVQELYRQAGYGAVIAYVPEQTAGAGTATIAVLEGRITRIDVGGNKQFSEANILRSLPLLAKGQTPQVQRIDAQIQLANENPAKQVAVSLEAGQRQGEVDAHITVTEQNAQRWTLALDNTGNASTGRLRANLGYQHGALWDLDHQLSLQFQFAPEKLSSVAVFSASYRVPFYAQGMTLDGYAAHSNVDGGSTGTAAGPLQFSGKGQIYGMRLSKYLPRMGEVDHRLILGLDQRAYINDCSIAGLPAGACGTAGESITVHPLSLEYTLQKQGDTSMGANLSLIHNLGLGGRYGSDANFEAVRVGAKRRYTSLRMNLFGGMALPQQWALQGRLNSQYSGDALVSGEQFGLGGANSVRGYEEREILGDSGLSASIELYAPDMAKRFSDSLGQLRALAFVDGGKVRNQRGMPCRNVQVSCGLASVGMGLRLGAGPLQVRLDMAQALRAGARTERNDVGFHFQANYSFI